MKHLFFILTITLWSFSLFAADEVRSIDEVSRFVDEHFRAFGGSPFLYKENILIELKGDLSPSEQTIFRDLIKEISPVFADQVVDVVHKTGNLIFNIKRSKDKDVFASSSYRTAGNAIVETTVVLNIPSNFPVEKEKKLIYSFFMRALVIPRGGKTETVYFPGCVYSESDPQKVTFSSADLLILRELYTYPEKQKKSRELRNATDGMVRDEVLKPKGDSWGYSQALFDALGLVLFSIYMLVMSRFFRDYKGRFDEFMRQTLLLFCGVFIFAVFSFVDKRVLISLVFSKVGVQALIIPIVFAVLFFVSATFVFLIEFVALDEESGLLRRIVVPFLATILVPVLFVLSLMASIGKAEVDLLVRMSLTITFFCSFVGILRAVFIFMRIQSENAISKKDVELARLSELNKQIELQSLQAKINPHFLYNSLNSIASLAATDTRKTEKMALALSDFFKYSINKEQKAKALLVDEIRTAETYLEIEKLRFGDRLDYELDVVPELLTREVPRFVIQPLIENAVKHGVSKIVGVGKIRLEIKKESTQIEIRVFDNGPDFPEGIVSGYGLQCIQDKLTLMYGKKAYLSWVNGENKHILVSIPTESKR